jgi:hypothetical protein
MRKLFSSATEASDYWLAGAFARRPHPFADPAIATWSEILGRDQAKLWMAARLSEKRGR